MVLLVDSIAVVPITSLLSTVNLYKQYKFQIDTSTTCDHNLTFINCELMRIRDLWTTTVAVNVQRWTTIFVVNIEKTELFSFSLFSFSVSLRDLLHHFIFERRERASKSVRVSR